MTREPLHTDVASEPTALPPPRTDGPLSLEEVLKARRSVRDFSDKPLTLSEISQLLWAAQGITDPDGLRTTPSAGALYPIEMYVVVGSVQGLDAGVYHYRPASHDLKCVRGEDVRTRLAGAAVGQRWVRTGAAVLVIGAVFSRTTETYDERGRRYVHIEAGHAAQNVCLQAVSLGLGAVPVAAFEDDIVRRLAAMRRDERPLYLLPVGRLNRPPGH